MKKTKNKIMSIFAIFAIVLTSMIGSFTEVSASTVNVGVVPTGYKHMGDAPMPDGSIFHYDALAAIEMITLSNGETGFCIEPWTLVNNKFGYTPSFKEVNTYSYIIYHGYTNTARTPYDYAVTQLMIWETVGYYPTSHTVPNYQQRKAEIQNAINNHHTKPSFNGGNFEVNVDEEIRLTDTNNVISQFMHSMSIPGANFRLEGNTLVITPTKDCAEDTRAIASKVKTTDIGASLIYRNYGSQTIVSEKLADPLPFSFNLNVNHIFGKVAINKTLDDPNESVGVGYTFNIYDAANTLVSTITTDETGYAESELLRAGEYKIEEVKKDGFTVVEPFFVSIEENDKVYTFDITNEVEKATLLFEKKGEVFTHSDMFMSEHGTTHSPLFTQKNIVGAEIEVYAAEDIIHDGTLYYEKDELVDTLRSELDAVESKSLPLGEYYYVETKAPLGYIPNEEKQFFSLNTAGASVLSELVNHRSELSLNFTKTLEKDTYSSVSTEAYKDVVFGVFTREDIYNYMGEVGFAFDTLLYTSGINEDGTLTTPMDLPIGSYYLKELATNGAYVLDDTEYNFTVNPSVEAINAIDINGGEPIVNNLKDYEVKINKVDDTTDKNITNKQFEFTAYADAECTEVIQTVQGDKEAGAAFFTLHEGEYYIKETKAPEGYLLSPEVVHVEVVDGEVLVNEIVINAEEDVYSIVYFNSPKRSVYTGDTTNMNYFLYLGILSGLAASVMALKKRKETK